jgi:hypothetical protein
MPWYYAGPEAKPVGPVTLEELQALRGKGTVKPETYVIEDVGQGMAGLAWKRYAEAFPATPDLPPLPPVPYAVHPPTPASTPTPPPIPPQPAAPTAHPLFPSAAPVPGSYSPPPPVPPVHQGPPAFAPGPRPDPYHTLRPTNAWSAWGFGLGLAAFFFSFVCGTGLLPAILSIPLCIIGLVQLQKHREQVGHWLSIWGLVLSSLALVVSLTMILWLAFPFMKAHGLTVTEETTNDSQ